MPETFDLDRAFEALAHDVMDRTSPPSAGRAIEQARRRRRTAIATVALAAAVVVGGVAVPTLLDDSSGIGFADGLPDAAPLDAAALNDATKGWLSGWREGSSGSFTQPSCLMDSEEHPEPIELRGSNFGGGQESGALPLFLVFNESAPAEITWTALNAPLTRCAGADVTETSVPDYPAGTTVRHYSVSDPSSESGAALTDVWVARTGNTVGILSLTTAAGGASDDSIDRLSDALVAGMLDGSAQVVEHPQAVPDVKLRPQLPYTDERILKSALAGWRNAVRVDDAATLPHAPCLKEFERGAAGSSSGEPSGEFFRVEGYEQKGPEAGRQVQTAVESLRACDVAMIESSLPGGVSLFTYDRGGDAGHGAVWLANNEDRAVVVALDGAASPMPAQVGPAVGEFMTSALALPWPEAS